MSIRLIKSELAIQSTDKLGDIDYVESKVRIYKALYSHKFSEICTQPEYLAVMVIPFGRLTRIGLIA